MKKALDEWQVAKSRKAKRKEKGDVTSPPTNPEPKPKQKKEKPPKACEAPPTDAPETPEPPAAKKGKLKVEIGIAPEFQGWLSKQTNGTEHSKQRWFELRGQQLYWFSEPNGKPKGIVELPICSLQDDTGYSNAFCLLSGSHSKSSECYFLRANTPEEKQAWIDHLAIAMNTPFSPTNQSGLVVEADFDSQLEKEDTPSVSISIPAEVPPVLRKICLNDFELIAVVGRGSYGKVMKVRRKAKGTLHAMKVMSKEALIQANMVEYTRLERQLLASIDHPFVASLKWTFQTKAKLYLVMDFLQGGELYVHLRHKGHFKESRAKFYASQVVLAFEYLHSKNILFRDLKPENVVLDKDGYACLTDFGMARQVLPEQRATSFCGTDAYISPEMIKGEPYGLENDWWSLGVLIFEMLAGEVPWYSENVKEMYDMILMSPLMFERPVTSASRDIIVRLLSRDKSERLIDPVEIKAHPFFKGIDWERVLHKEVRAPFVPDITDDTKYFDKQFTSEKPILSHCDAPHPTHAPLFVGFSYPGRPSPAGTPA